MFMSPYARLEVGLIFLLGGAITFATGYFFGWWALLPGLFALALMMFYRDPPRSVTPGGDLVLAPADGKIMNVERDWLADDGAAPELRITIFLSVFNVHMNRAPCAGRVTDALYSPGLFLNALKAEATTRNENNLITIKPKAPLPGPVLVRQISGVLAKRIVCALEPGDDVVSGETYGMIKLGSQTEIRMPENSGWQVFVKPGDSVRAGLTKLARIKTD